ncbi:MAG TPA: 4Fe-4S dicluster domain-containing protein [candidate division WOR-3 bacterium]|uniref:4Fe-4S dicluster domain-containing protein n=1 Tax=candidate division WOR-3 bacterium TaxID=2052148 RepID=A0A7C0ZD05_UNCW3|nr:4Fe-4S dicluster domain-containing protein [candidate division WOR-3 bacterium]
MADEVQHKLIPVYILSKKYYVPEGSTIITAMEYAGFKLKKGVGCREGFCGACASLYRLPGDYKLHGGLGCQTVVQPEMQIVQIPFAPAEKKTYDIEKLTPDNAPFNELYPEVYRCVSCNTCTKICPQELQVMDYVNAIIRGDLKLAMDLSFDCIMCGLCSVRCPAEMAQFNIAMLARRLYGKYLQPVSEYLEQRLKEIAEGKFEEQLRELMSLSREELQKRYYERELNFDIT